jgi:hypothetical protein
MRKLLTLSAVGVLALGTASVATAADFPVTATLSVAIGTLPPAAFNGAAAAASSAGTGGAATLPAGAIMGTFQTAIDPPLAAVIDGIGVALPGIANNAPFAANAQDAVNDVLAWDGADGTMSLDSSAYLLTGGNNAAEIPLGVVGVGGTQMFHALSLVSGVINANPYQLGMVTLMGALNTAAHTVMGTGVDNRTAMGGGTLVLVSPTTVNLGALGNLASLATLTLTYAPEPGAVLLMGAGAASLLAVGWKRKKRV